MKKFKLPKRYFAGIAALVIAVAGLGLSSAYAGNEIDLTKPCSLTLEVEGGSYAEDLAKAELNAKIYQVATVDENGVYTDLEDYKSLGLGNAVLKGGDWSKKAQDAAAIAAEKTPDAQIAMTAGKGSVNDLKAGMYLVVLEDGLTDCYAYTFSPYLICLPDNLYAQTGNESDNYYKYDVTAGLKAEQSKRYGDLKIQKTLSSYNTSLQNVTFVFDVEAVDVNGEVVYSNVVSTTHNAAGTKEIVIEGIPAGSTVTVKEVYAGASYKVTGNTSMNTVIVADDTVTTAFANNYDEQLVNSNGVTNHFEYDDSQGWKWERLEDNSTVNQ
ncbi:MAG: hypothetical protein J6B26_08895 [Agathobacter sp.]|nr:hypothetical protein [Agathobacter sp.]